MKSLLRTSLQTHHKESWTTSLLPAEAVECITCYPWPADSVRASVLTVWFSNCTVSDLDSWKDHQGLSSVSRASRGQKHCGWSITPLPCSVLPAAFWKTAVEGPLMPGHTQTTKHEDKDSIWTVNKTASINQNKTLHVHPYTPAPFISASN